MLYTFFWILFFIIFYAYIGYTIILLVLALFKRNFKLPIIKENDLPEVTLLIAAYNERDIIEQKIKDCSQLDYPKEKLKIVWVTDGSNDGSVEILKNIDNIKVIHENIRAGKTAALNRAIPFINTEIVVFNDANTFLNPDTIKNLIRWFEYSKIGCVAGEKRITTSKADNAAGAGEGLYWNYESFIKKMESKVGSTMGAAGELYAIRTALYNPPKNNIVLDDFMVSMSIAAKGLKIHYDPEAIASESSSLSIAEEIKRKVRIAAGGFQVLFSNSRFLNFFKHFSLSFQYFSHKVLRWFLVPFSFLAIFIVNILIAIQPDAQSFYLAFIVLQVIFYILSILGAFMQNKNIQLKVFFMPFYISMMNYSIILGLFRYLKGSQKAAWEKSKRA